MTQSDSLAVFYLFRAGDPNCLTLARRFVTSYAVFAAERDHTLYILWKGWVSHDPEADAIFDGLQHHSLSVADEGFDMASYVTAAQLVSEGSVCFLNSYSEIRSPAWLLKLSQSLTLPTMGLVGATGSFECQLTELPPFPNLHLRTTGFLIARDFFLELTKDYGFMTKHETFLFESGHDSFTRRVLALGRSVCVVGADGMTYPPHLWPFSRTFRSHKQENLLIGDNHTTAFLDVDEARRTELGHAAWGDLLA